MKYFEFIVEEKLLEFEFHSAHHLIEAETEKQAYDYALAYLKDFRGEGAIELEEDVYEYGCGLIVSIHSFNEVDRWEWIKRQVEFMTLKYNQKFVDSMKKENIKKDFKNDV